MLIKLSPKIGSINEIESGDLSSSDVRLERLLSKSQSKRPEMIISTAFNHALIQLICSDRAVWLRYLNLPSNSVHFQVWLSLLSLLSCQLLEYRPNWETICYNLLVDFKRLANRKTKTSIFRVSTSCIVQFQSKANGSLTIAKISIRWCRVE